MWRHAVPCTAPCSAACSAMQCRAVLHCRAVNCHAVQCSATQCFSLAKGASRIVPIAKVISTTWSSDAIIVMSFWTQFPQFPVTGEFWVVLTAPLRHSQSCFGYYPKCSAFRIPGPQMALPVGGRSWGGEALVPITVTAVALTKRLNQAQRWSLYLW